MTVTFDPSTRPDLQGQEIQHPWRRKPLRFTFSVVVASLVPLMIVAALYVTSDIPGALLMTVVYLPLQLACSGIAASRMLDPARAAGSPSGHRGDESGA